MCETKRNKAEVTCCDEWCWGWEQLEAHLCCMKTDEISQLVLRVLQSALTRVGMKVKVEQRYKRYTKGPNGSSGTQAGGGTNEHKSSVVSVLKWSSSPSQHHPRFLFSEWHDASKSFLLVRPKNGQKLELWDKRGTQLRGDGRESKPLV